MDVDQSGWANGMEFLLRDDGGFLTPDSGDCYLKVLSGTSITTDSATSGAASIQFGTRAAGIGSGQNITIAADAATLPLILVNAETTLDLDIGDRVADDSWRWALLAETEPIAEDTMQLEDNAQTDAFLAILWEGATLVVCQHYGLFEQLVIDTGGIDTVNKRVTFTAGLAAQMQAGSIVALEDSNIKLIGGGQGNNGHYMLRGAVSDAYIRCAASHFHYLMGSTPGHSHRNTFAGSTWGTKTTLYQGSCNTVTGPIRAYNNVSTSFTATIKGHILGRKSCVFGMGNGIYATGGGTAHVVNGYIKVANTPVSGSASAFICGNGAVISGGSSGLFAVAMVQGRSLTNLTIENTSSYALGIPYTRMVIHGLTLINNTLDHAAVADWVQDYGTESGYWIYDVVSDGAIGTAARYHWGPNGTIKTDATPPASGPAVADEYTFQANTGPLYWEERMTLAPGQRVRAHAWAYPGVSLDTDFTLYICTPDTDPFLVYPDQPMRITGVSDSDVHTGAATTWEQLGVTHFNDTGEVQEVIIRIMAANGSGTGHALMTIKKPMRAVSVV